jgi:hypothetical protein
MNFIREKGFVNITSILTSDFITCSLVIEKGKFMKGTPFSVVSRKITDEDWLKITTAFENTPHFFVLEALRENRNEPVAIISLEKPGRQTVRYTIVRINDKMSRFSMPYTIRMVEWFKASADTLGSFQLCKIRRPKKIVNKNWSYEI